MKYSLLLAVIVASFGLSACGKPAAAPLSQSYTGPQKAAYEAAVEKCKTVAFDSRESCAKKIMAAGTK